MQREFEWDFHYRLLPTVKVSPMECAWTLDVYGGRKFQICKYLLGAPRKLFRICLAAKNGLRLFKLPDYPILNFPQVIPYFSAPPPNHQITRSPDHKFCFSNHPIHRSPDYPRSYPTPFIPSSKGLRPPIPICVPPRLSAAIGFPAFSAPPSRDPDFQSPDPAFLRASVSPW